MTEPHRPQHEQAFISEREEQLFQQTVVRESLGRTALRARLIPDVVERYTDPLVRTPRRKLLAAAAFTSVAIAATAGYPAMIHNGAPQPAVGVEHSSSDAPQVPAIWPAGETASPTHTGPIPFPTVSGHPMRVSK